MRENVLEIVAAVLQFGTAVMRLSPDRLRSMLHSEFGTEMWFVCVAVVVVLALAALHLGTQLHIPKPSQLIPLYLWTFIHVLNVYDVYRSEGEKQKGYTQVPTAVIAFLVTGGLLLRHANVPPPSSSARSSFLQRLDPERRDYKDDLVADDA